MNYSSDISITATYFIITQCIAIKHENSLLLLSIMLLVLVLRTDHYQA